MATILELLSTGRLDGLTLGMTLGEVEKILGPPDDRSVRNKPLILKYGALEVAFGPMNEANGLRLVSMHLYLGDPYRNLPDAVRPSDWLPSSGSTEKELRESVTRLNLQPQAVADGENLYFAFPSGASVVFVSGKLHSIHLTRRTAETRKQVSVLLPKETVDRLRRRASEQKVSVQRFVEKLITDGTRAE